MDDIVKKLRQQARGPVVRSGQMAMLEAAAEIERLRAERDELRREVCRSRSKEIDGWTPEWIAEAHNWDCFKEKP